MAFALSALFSISDDTQPGKDPPAQPPASFSSFGEFHLSFTSLHILDFRYDPATTGLYLSSRRDFLTAIVSRSVQFGYSQFV